MVPWLLHALSQVLGGAIDMIMQIHKAASLTYGGVVNCGVLQQAEDQLWYVCQHAMY